MNGLEKKEQPEGINAEMTIYLKFTTILRKKVMNKPRFSMLKKHNTTSLDLKQAII